MADQPEKQAHQHRQLSIQTDTETASGVYSNLMMINHRKEEFILDFLFVQPQASTGGQAVATLRSRVVTSPEHLKRIARAIDDNIRKYEEKFGAIEVADDLPRAIH